MKATRTVASFTGAASVRFFINEDIAMGAHQVKCSGRVGRYWRRRCGRSGERGWFIYLCDDHRWQPLIGVVLLSTTVLGFVSSAMALFSTAPVREEAVRAIVATEVANLQGTFLMRQREIQRTLTELARTSEATEAGQRNLLLLLEAGLVPDPTGEIRRFAEGPRQAAAGHATALTAHLRINNSEGIIRLRGGEPFYLSWLSQNAAACQIEAPTGSSGISLAGNDGPIERGHPWYPETGAVAIFAFSCTDGVSAATTVVPVIGG